MMTAVGMILLLFSIFGFTATEQKAPFHIPYIGNFSQP